jgi:hypothetical protein
MLTRREFLRAGGVALAGLSVPSTSRVALLHTPRAAQAVEIRMRSDKLGTRVLIPSGFIFSLGKQYAGSSLKMSIQHPRITPGIVAIHCVFPQTQHLGIPDFYPPVSILS